MRKNWKHDSLAVIISKKWGQSFLAVSVETVTTNTQHKATNIPKEHMSAHTVHKKWGQMLIKQLISNTCGQTRNSIIKFDRQTSWNSGRSCTLWHRCWRIWVKINTIVTFNYIQELYPTAEQLCIRCHKYLLPVFCK